MAHASPEELAHALEDAHMHVAVGDRYSHFKHPERAYTVTDLAILEATEEVAVVYQAEYGDRLTFIRPLASWLAMVEYEGQTVPRFSRID